MEKMYITMALIDISDSEVVVYIARDCSGWCIYAMKRYYTLFQCRAKATLDKAIHETVWVIHLIK